jgi:hypothetical protein
VPALVALVYVALWLSRRLPFGNERRADHVGVEASRG